MISRDISIVTIPDGKREVLVKSIESWCIDESIDIGYITDHGTSSRLIIFEIDISSRRRDSSDIRQEISSNHRVRYFCCDGDSSS